MESLRSMGIFDICEVQLAVVETTGKISVYQKQQFRPVTNGSMKIIDDDEGDPPQLVVDNGKIIDSTLRFIGKDRDWLMEKLDEKKVPLRQVYICTADDSGKITVIGKEQKK